MKNKKKLHLAVTPSRPLNITARRHQRLNRSTRVALLHHEDRQDRRLRALLDHNYDPQAALGDDLISYWDANRGDLISVVNNGVSSWKDVVAGYDLTQSTANRRPFYSPTSFAGAPAINFDGIDKFLVGTGADLLAALPSGSTPSEIWVLVTQEALPTDTSTRYVAGYSGSSVVNGRAIARTVVSGANRARGYTGIGASAVTVTDTVVDLSGAHVIRHIVGAAQSSIIVDGEAANDAAVVPTTVVERFRVGAISASGVSNYWQGQVAAVLITKPLSAEKADGLRMYLG